MGNALVVESEVHAGMPEVVESIPEGHRFGVVFEDDGDTGYLYGLDLSRSDQPIIDALHIYNVGQDKKIDERCLLTIRWSGDLSKAALYLNGRPEAAFDFGSQRAMSRSNFPPADGIFAATHAWDDSLLLGI